MKQTASNEILPMFSEQLRARKSDLFTRCFLKVNTLLTM
jgi:hypothetical protein